MGNAFVSARDANLAEGTMTPGVKSQPQPQKPAQYAAQQAAAPTLQGRLYQVEVAGRSVTVQADIAQIEDLRSFLEPYGDFEIKAIHLMDVNVLKAGLMFALPTPPKPDKPKRKSTRRKAKKGNESETDSTKA